MKKFIIGADRMAIPLKDELVAYLEEAYGYEVDDVGMKAGGEFVSYIDTASRVAREVGSGNYEKGILLCGTGAGMTIVSNKFKGVRAVLCYDAYQAERCRTINDANIMCMGGTITTPTIGKMMVDAFLTTEFKAAFPEDRHEFLENAKKTISAMGQ